MSKPGRGFGPTPDRPHMPEGYGLRPFSDDTAERWDTVTHKLAEAHNYWVVTARPDGRPHSVPVWGLWLDDTFYFATDRASRKAHNIVANPSVVVHLESGDEVVIVEGTAAEVEEIDVLSRIGDAYHAKYQVRLSIADRAQVMYAVRPHKVLAWGEQDFPISATRWQFKRA